MTPRGDHQASEKRCIGFGEREGLCENAADTPAGLWCQDCETERRAYITDQFAAITASFTESSTQDKEE